MSSDGLEGWSLRSIGELARVVTGTTPKAANPEHFGEGVPFLTPSDISGEGKHVHTRRFLSDEGASSFEAKLLPAGTPCFVAIGSTIGKTCVASERSLTNQQIHAAIPRSSVGDGDFLYYALTHRASDLRRIAGGSATPILKKSAFEKFELAVPHLHEQRRIAWILSSLDDKIENNRRITKTLEEIAATLFKARFVDFVDHDDLVESEIGPIPRQWTPVPVANLARYVNGKAFTKFGNDRGRMVIRIAELRSGPGGATVYTDHETKPDFIAQSGDILFAWSGSLDVYRWYRDEALINQHVFKVIPIDRPAWLAFYALKHVMPHFQAIAADKATTMGHIKRSHLSQYAVAVPPDNELVQHDRVFAPLFERALRARLEVETLTRIRDALLPRLVSGQIRVPAGAVPEVATA